MFGKLLKYDLRSMWKQFGLVWPAALLTAAVNRILLQARLPFEPNETLGTKASDLMLLVFFGILVAMLVLTVVYIIQRFYKGLLGDEGYLMHTLPVKPWQLVGSKLTCAMLVMFISLIVAVASMLLLMPFSLEEFRTLWTEFAALFRKAPAEQVGSFTLLLLEFVLAALAAMVRAFLQVYLAMAVGHLFSKNRVAASVVAYVAINAAVTTVSDLLLGTSTGITLTSVALQTSDAIHITGQQPYLAAFDDLLLISLIAEVVLSALFFLATNYILKNKLNLE